MRPTPTLAECERRAREAREHISTKAAGTTMSVEAWIAVATRWERRAAALRSEFARRNSVDCDPSDPEHINCNARREARLRAQEGTNVR